LAGVEAKGRHRLNAASGETDVRASRLTARSAWSNASTPTGS
jgi:hypothetical protein